MRILVGKVLATVLAIQFAMSPVYSAPLLCQLSLNGGASQTVEDLLQNRLGDGRIMKSQAVRAFRNKMDEEITTRQANLNRNCTYQEIKEIFDRNFSDLKDTLNLHGSQFGLHIRDTAFLLVPLGIYIGLAHATGNPHAISTGITGFVSLILISIGTSVPAINNLKAFVSNMFNRVALGKSPTQKTDFSEFVNQRRYRDAKYNDSALVGSGRVNAFQGQLRGNISQIVEWMKIGKTDAAGKVLAGTAMDLYEFFNDFQITQDPRVTARIREQMEIYWKPQVESISQNLGYDQQRMLAELKQSAMTYLKTQSRFAGDPKALSYFEILLSYWTLTA